MTEKQTKINAFSADPDDLVIVGLDTKDGPDHPLYDKRINLPVDENLVHDMMMNGFTSTIICRENGEVLEVAVGRQRVKCARAANKLLKKAGKELLRVLYTIRKGDDADFLGVRIGENTHRTGLKVLDMADDLKKYLEAGRSEEQAAITFGMSKQNVKNLMKLHDLSGDVRKAIQRGDITPSGAAPLAKLPREEQNEALEKLLSDAKGGKKATRAAAKKAVKKKTGEGESTPPAKRLINDILKLNKKLPDRDQLNGEFVRGIRWTLGDFPSSSIPGLRALETAVEDLKAEQKAKKSKKAE